MHMWMYGVNMPNNNIFKDVMALKKAVQFRTISKTGTYVNVTGSKSGTI